MVDFPIDQGLQPPPLTPGEGAPGPCRAALGRGGAGSATGGAARRAGDAAWQRGRR
jgi:hypothetical protein